MPRPTSHGHSRRADPCFWSSKAALSKALKEGEQWIGRLVASWYEAARIGMCECAFFESHIRMQEPDSAIDELNIRFKEAGVGYQFEQGELIKVDSQFIHSEVVKPALQLLGKDKDYQGSSAEFLAAHEHYRHQRYKECLNECLKAFESVMKAIHKKHSWNFNKNDNSKKLINNCLTNHLIPQYLQTQFCSISTLLETGAATIRNKEGGHGQGTEVKEVPEYLASYALHLTASNLLFLIKCEENYIK